MASEFGQNLTSKLGPSYAFTFGWEENFDADKSIAAFGKNWYIPYVISFGIYLPTIYVGQMIMRIREPLNVKTAMLLWNISLAIFSILGFLRVFPEMLHSLNEFGFQHTICNSSYIQVKPCIFWVNLFVLSKIPELIDTVFLVLRKQKLLFLHVYHHASVLLFSWYIYMYTTAAARWFCTMNYGIHSLMYSYYALKAMPNLVRVPKSVSMLITALQTTQMVMGTYVIIAARYAKSMGHKCDLDISTTIFGLVIYVSYLILFSRFFYNAYCSPSPPRDAKGAAVNDKKRA